MNGKRNSLFRCGEQSASFDFRFYGAVRARAMLHDASKQTLSGNPRMLHGDAAALEYKTCINSPFKSALISSAEHIRICAPLLTAASELNNR
jgi:hypothetical protein